MNYFQDAEKALLNLSSKGAFFTTKNQQIANTMTITWGYIGFSYRKPVFIAMIRPSRYTFSLLQSAKDFTISIPYTENFKNALSICGSTSGKDVDKELMADIEFCSSKNVNSPIVKNCDKFYECKITYLDKLYTENMNDELISFYKNGDCHYLVFGEIIDTY